MEETGFLAAFAAVPEDEEEDCRSVSKQEGSVVRLKEKEMKTY